MPIPNTNSQKLLSPAALFDLIRLLQAAKYSQYRSNQGVGCIQKPNGWRLL